MSDVVTVRNRHGVVHTVTADHAAAILVPGSGYELVPGTDLPPPAGDAAVEAPRRSRKSASAD